MRSGHVDYVRWTYSRIEQYCDARRIGGYYGQEEYKFDFMRILIDAYCAGICGKLARRTYNKIVSKLKKKKPPFGDYAVTGQSIRDRLSQTWMRGRNHNSRDEQMLRDLSDWWDCWTYAFDSFPGDVMWPRSRGREIRLAMIEWAKKIAGKTG